MLILWPGVMKFGSVILGFAASREERGMPNAAAMEDRVSPELTVYVAVPDGLGDGVAGLADGRLMYSPGEMKFGSAIWGLIASRAANEMPYLWARDDRVSPLATI